MMIDHAEAAKSDESREDQEGAEAPSSSTVRRRGPSRILLVVEDDVLGRTLRRLLERRGYKVGVARAAEIPAALGPHRGLPHLIVVDWDGAEVRQTATWTAVLKAAGEVPVLCLRTGHDVFAGSSIAGAAVCSLAKDELWERVSKLVDRLAGDRAARLGEEHDDRPDE